MSNSSLTGNISVIIPFKDKSAMTLACVRSLLSYGPRVKEILLVSNNSRSDELAVINDFCKKHKDIRCVEYNHPFHYQKICNWSAGQTTGNLIMFLNNDTELRPASRGLIDRMAKKTVEPHVGIAGCLLLYGDERTIQHAGVFLMPKGMADHLYVGKKLPHAISQANTAKFPYDVRESRPVTAVTGAVSLVERTKFDDVGGYDERFIVCGGDVDLCIRLNKAGYQTWYVGEGYILHKESQSRAQQPVSYNDFYYSYLSYIEGFDPAVGDPCLPEITKHMA